MAGKRLQLLRELIPTAKRVATLSHPPHPTNARQLEGAETVARALGVKLEAVAVRDADDFDSALKALRGIDGLLHADTPLFTTHRARLAEVVARRRLPTIFAFRGYVDAGGLMSYGADQPDLYRRAATYIDKVLKGAKPAACLSNSPRLRPLSRLILSRARAAARWTASHGIFSLAEPVVDVSECSLPVVKKVQRQPSSAYRPAPHRATREGDQPHRRRRAGSREARRDPLGRGRNRPEAEGSPLRQGRGGAPPVGEGGETAEDGHELRRERDAAEAELRRAPPERDLRLHG